MVAVTAIGRFADHSHTGVRVDHHLLQDAARRGDGLDKDRRPVIDMVRNVMQVGCR